MEKSGKVLEELKRVGIFRQLRPSESRGGKILIGKREFANFASNDYLGVSSRLDLQREFLGGIAGDSFLMGATSSRLLGGDNFAFENLEAYFAGLFSEAFGAPRSCLLFNGGFHANTGALPAFASSKDLVVCDKLSHASIIDSLKLGNASWLRFKHNDLSHLRRILDQNCGKYENIYIATESVFSMDGDRADIRGLVEIKKEYGVRRYIDEAHSFGLFGGGLGLCAESGLGREVDFVMCTLGKAVGSQGAIIICSMEDRDILINNCRPFVFTTASAPITALWTHFIFPKILAMAAERARLMELSELLRRGLENFETLGDTQIVPILVGAESKAVDLSEKLLEAGIWAPAVRYPSVPRGRARIRVSISAASSADDILRLSEIVNSQGAIR